ncbi:hypothetical protein OG894_43910 (plasmid) [Streptomyces sp. NBC_01724]|uniref:hypothetical protein n=1 Tax=Streptomyces sp. NBC_01724 TaxID=2975922 RepID=UPI002E36C7C6|nr:hypothetical protein [Streptomyces sp. NBC_01724]
MAVPAPSLVFSSRPARRGLVAVVARYGNGSANAPACARLLAGVQVRQTAGHATSPAKLALSRSSRHATEEDCQVIGAAEPLGLDKGAAQ